MSQLSPEQIEQIFRETSRLPVKERPEVARRACRGDAAALAEIERRLGLELGSQSYGDSEALFAPNDPEPKPAGRAAGPGPNSGEWRLLEDPGLELLPEYEGYRRLGSVLIYGRLGAGGMGSVYEGIHVFLERRVAVKTILPRLAERGQWRERFQREARAAAAIDDPHVVRVIDSNIAHGLPYLIMELVEGESCGDRLQRLGTFSVAETTEVAHQAAGGLATFHRAGLVHRDIKPDNLLLRNDGVVKVADLGLAKPLEGEDHVTTTREVFGTPGYMAPEVFEGVKFVGPPSDVFALGVSLYTLMTGRRLFLTERSLYESIDSALDQLPGDCPDSLRQLLRESVASHASDRPSDAAEFLARLESLELPRGEFRQPVDRRVPSTVKAPPSRETIVRARQSTEGRGSDEAEADVAQRPSAAGRLDGAPPSGKTPAPSTVDALHPVRRWITAAVLVTAAAIGIHAWNSEPNDQLVNEGRTPVIAFSPAEASLALVSFLEAGDVVFVESAVQRAADFLDPSALDAWCAGALESAELPWLDGPVGRAAERLQRCLEAIPAGVQSDGQKKLRLEDFAAAAWPRLETTEELATLDSLFQAWPELSLDAPELKSVMERAALLRRAIEQVETRPDDAIPSLPSEPRNPLLDRTEARALARRVEIGLERSSDLGWERLQEYGQNLRRSAFLDDSEATRALRLSWRQAMQEALEARVHCSFEDGLRRVTPSQNSVHVTSSRAVTLSGRVEADAVASGFELEIQTPNTKSIPIGVAGEFELAIPLQEGWNTFPLTARVSALGISAVLPTLQVYVRNQFLLPPTRQTPDGMQTIDRDIEVELGESVRVRTAVAADVPEVVRNAIHVQTRIGDQAARPIPSDTIEILLDQAGPAVPVIVQVLADRIVLEEVTFRVRVRPGHPELAGLDFVGRRDSYLEYELSELGLRFALVHAEPPDRWTDETWQDRFAVRLGDETEDRDGPRVVELAPYLIALTEVTVEQFGLFLKSRGKEWPDRTRRFWNDQGSPPQHPVSGVTWQEARDFARWATRGTGWGEGDLPTEAQHEFAASKSGESFPYPWGAAQPGKRLVNYGGAYVERVHGGSEAGRLDDQRREREKDGFLTTAAIDECENGRSPFGLYHLAGNVSEWCRDRYLEFPNSSATFRSGSGEVVSDSDSSHPHTVRGGHFEDYEDALRVYRRTHARPDDRDTRRGFRIVIEPRSL